jgi:hypothetical protein
MQTSPSESDSSILLAVFVSDSSMLLAVFVGNQVTIHVGKIEKAEEYRYKHVGKLAKPPYTPERLDEIGPLVPTDLWAEGVSFERGCIDVIFAGLGWICLSGRGRCELTAWAPEGVGVMTRWDLTSRNCCAGAGPMMFAAQMNRISSSVQSVETRL